MLTLHFSSLRGRALRGTQDSRWDRLGGEGAGSLCPAHPKRRSVNTPTGMTMELNVSNANVQKQESPEFSGTDGRDSPQLALPAAGSVSQRRRDSVRGQATERLPAPPPRAPTAAPQERAWLDHDTQQLGLPSLEPPRWADPVGDTASPTRPPSPSHTTRETGRKTDGKTAVGGETIMQQSFRRASVSRYSQA